MSPPSGGSVSPLALLDGFRLPPRSLTEFVARATGACIRNILPQTLGGSADAVPGMPIAGRGFHTK